MPVSRHTPGLNPNAKTTLAFLAALVALGPSSVDMYLPAMPAMQQAFATDIVHMHFTLSAYLWGFALFPLACGPLADRLGRKPLILCGTGNCAGASALVYAGLMAYLACSGFVFISMPGVPVEYFGLIFLTTVSGYVGGSAVSARLASKLAPPDSQDRSDPFIPLRFFAGRAVCGDHRRGRQRISIITATDDCNDGRDAATGAAIDH